MKAAIYARYSSDNQSIMFTNSWTQNPENKINYTHE